MKPIKPHDSQRGHFAWYLYDLMLENKDIWLVTGDLGFGQFDAIRNDFPERFLNVGAAEQTMLDVASGLAMSGKIVFTYTITPFYTRGFETIRNYIDHEKLNVKLVGGGRDRDYLHDGFSHWAEDIPGIFTSFKNVVEYYPTTRNRIKNILTESVRHSGACFISLSR